MVPVAIDNDSVILQAAELVRARLDAHLSAPESWRAVGADVQIAPQTVIRLRQAGDSAAADVEIFR
jgi:hypothetical protein